MVQFTWGTDMSLAVSDMREWVDIIGGLIAIFIVFLFLRNMRSALILGLSIPISIIATFVMMYYFDFPLNMMSMGGLAIGVGIHIMETSLKKEL